MFQKIFEDIVGLIGYYLLIFNMILMVLNQNWKEKTSGNSHFELAEFSGITVSHQVFVKPKIEWLRTSSHLPSGGTSGCEKTSFGSNSELKNPSKLIYSRFKASCFLGCKL
jgi:hypothetical protein